MSTYKFSEPVTRSLTWRKVSCRCDWSYRLWNEEIILDCFSGHNLIPWVLQRKETFPAVIRDILKGEAQRDGNVGRILCLVPGSLKRLERGL